MIRMFVLLGIVLFIIGIGVWIGIHKRTNREFLFHKVGFKEYVRNPRLWHKHTQSRAEYKQMVANLTHEPPEMLVRFLLDDEVLYIVKPAIRQVGPEVVPYLIAALNDPEYRKPVDEKAQNSTHIFLRRSTPIVTVLECLEDYAPPSAVGSIAPLVTDLNKEIRQHAALVLGEIATDDTVEPLRKALADEDDYVRSYAMMGILRALEDGRGSLALRMNMFEAILPLIRRCSITGSTEAPGCLLKLDRERAISILTTADALAPGGENLKDILSALREAEVSVDCQTLLCLIGSLNEKITEYPNYYVVGEALQLLARIATTSTTVQAAIRREFDSPSKEVREKAYQAFAYTKGIMDPLGQVFDRLDQHGWDNLTTAQRHVLAVQNLIDEVNNGGFEQYFFNSSGDHWSDALAGFKAMQATKDFELVQRAFGYFGLDGPSTDREKRHRQLARVVKNDIEFFSPIEETFFKDEEDREVLLLRYIIEHESDFRGDKENRGQ